MSSLKVKIGGKSFEISVEKEYEEKVLSYAEKITESINKIKKEAGAGSRLPYEILLVLSSLASQEKIDELENILKKNNNIDQPAGDNIKPGEPLDLDSSNRLNNISLYLEDIANKMRS